MRKKFKNGFTLTELMTVVVILAILMGIAAGSYRKAAERSNFTEGLVAAHTLMEAVERYHANKNVTRPTIENLDISLAHLKSTTTYAITTKYFTVTVYDGYVQAVRNGSKYTITVYPETFGANKFHPDTCQGKNGKKDFCVSMGYTSCNGSGLCVKP